MLKRIAVICTITGLLASIAFAQAYEGNLDAARCDIIGGWAADGNNLGSSINVDIYDGNTYLLTTPASLYRQDVGKHPVNTTGPARRLRCIVVA